MHRGRPGYFFLFFVKHSFRRGGDTFSYLPEAPSVFSSSIPFSNPTLLLKSTGGGANFKPVQNYGKGRGGGGQGLEALKSNINGSTRISTNGWGGGGQLITPVGKLISQRGAPERKSGGVSKCQTW